MPLSLLEEAADTGFAQHRNQAGETIFAFRPKEISRYIDHLLDEIPLSGLQARPSSDQRQRIRIAEAEAEASPDSVHIRPRVGMFSAFARLNYTPWFALAEFVDNSVQSFLANRGRLSQSDSPLLVDIRIDEDEIVISDRAAGIHWSEFPRAFSPSQPPPDASGLSEFGLGMKAAACWFARRWSVRTSALGESIERTIRFDVPKITSEGIEHLPFESRAVNAEDHYTVVTLEDLRVRPRGRTVGKIKDHLSSIYRILLREGVVRIRLTTTSGTEDLQYEEPTLLRAPLYRSTDNQPLLWRKEFDVALDDRRVWGWAGILQTMSVSRSGFGVFRRGRLIQGSADNAYRPPAIFRGPQSYSYRRVVGELFVEGFNVSHTKDGIQWDGLEDQVADNVRQELDSAELPLLRQAEHYRARTPARTLEPGFGSSAVEATGGALQNAETASVVAQETATQPSETPATRDRPDRLLTRRTYSIRYGDNVSPLSVALELVADPAMDWYQLRTEPTAEETILHVSINLSHPFSEHFINDSEERLVPVVRLVAAMALSEHLARLSGLPSAGDMRRRINRLLRNALSTTSDDDSGQEL